MKVFFSSSSLFLCAQMACDNIHIHSITQKPNEYWICIVLRASWWNRRHLCSHANSIDRALNCRTHFISNQSQTMQSTWHDSNAVCIIITKARVHHQRQYRYISTRTRTGTQQFPRITKCIHKLMKIPAVWMDWGSDCKQNEYWIFSI